MILILDTDHLTIIPRQTEPAYSYLRARLGAFQQEDVRSTIVSFEEQMRGWLSTIAASKTKEGEADAYRRLSELLMFFGSIPILPFGNQAAEQFAKLRRLRLRIGSMDLKIAAIALTQHGTLLSRNLKVRTSRKSLTCGSKTGPPNTSDRQGRFEHV